MPPVALQTLVQRYDRTVFEPQGARARVRLQVADAEAWDVVLEHGRAKLGYENGRADATLTADAAAWEEIARDPALGMGLYRAGRLGARRNLHLAVGFLAATSGDERPGRLRFRTVQAGSTKLSLMEAGEGPVLLAIHGLGGTKGSFLPTVGALAGQFRVIAADLPGFGDSDKPIGVSYDAAYFARKVIELLDVLEIERAHLVGNSLGGRIALETGLREPGRVDRLVLLCPSLAWRRGRPFVPLLRLTRPELGLVQIAPRGVVDAIVRRVIPNADDGWAAAGIDEFLRAYTVPAGRAAFYAAARHIYLEEPDGIEGFWTRLRQLQPDSLFVWGTHDRLVPIAFARHVAQTVPHAQHLELNCGHVPQVEAPRETHSAMARFLGAGAGAAAA